MAKIIGCPSVTLQVFHSMLNIDLPPRAKSQIAAITCIKEPNIVLDFVQVQEQHGFCDWSMFAIIFTTSLCGGYNPAESTYTEHFL